MEICNFGGSGGPQFTFYTTLTNFSTNYLVICKVYTDVGGMKKLYHVC